MIRWLSFFLAISALLFLSKKNLGIAMFTGAIILGIFTDPKNLPLRVWEGLTDPSTAFLVAIVSLIPVIGSILNETGQLDKLIKNIRVGRKLFLMLTPALIGLLPMPGGALLSVPLIDKMGAKLPGGRKAGVNVWFRHILYLIYPLSADLIVSTASAEIGLYQPIPYLLIILFFALFLGFLFLLRGDLGETVYKEEFSLRDLLPPLSILLTAPLLDLVISSLLSLSIREMATFLAILMSFSLAVIAGRLSFTKLYHIILKTKPWNFAFMMVGIMVFLRVFKDPGILSLFLEIPLTPEIIFVIAFLLGFITGRTVTPAGIIFPIYIMKFGSISPPVFSLLYFGIFLGYIMTPTHPCVSLTLVSLKVDLKDYFKAIIPPVGIASLAGLITILFLF